ncbi:hypothetical protein [Pelosinus fermentans]|uniref:Uncharacterized protein n=1 Tax=Pelosinus fermentans JBW45 TaxID=1192197 RepID=I9NX83_9FIRM|nr:hypothetical protein [Pelosinus fermentans]AJQ29410.1 hypothetical protein JBW_04077 [Pelosinus fermentans JBW45]
MIIVIVAPIFLTWRESNLTNYVSMVQAMDKEVKKWASISSKVFALVQSGLYPWR